MHFSGRRGRVVGSVVKQLMFVAVGVTASSTASHSLFASAKCLLVFSNSSLPLSPRERMEACP